jgi:hypothetical protein
MFFFAALSIVTLLPYGCGGSGSSSGSKAGGSVTPPVTPPATFAISAITNTAGTIVVTAASTSTLVAGDIILISGTTNYDGTYTIVSANATTFTVAGGVFPDEATGFWQLAGGLIAGCTTTGMTAAINLVNNLPTSVSRFTGVAPLAVFFDSAGTDVVPAQPAPFRAFRDLEYTWNFGDSGPSASPWTTGSRAGSSSRNAATGPVAAHVYETPGSYVVTLTVSDGTNTVANACVRIAVQDPNVVFANASTVCVSNSGAAPGCPGGATATHIASNSFDGSIAAHIGPNKRILFAGGEVFLATAAGRINTPGPGIIGSFGGGKAIVQSAGATSRIAISSGTTPTTADWRVMDLDLDGQSSPTHRGVSASGSASQITFVRLRVHDLQFGFVFDPNLLDGQNTPTLVSPMWDQIAIVDSTIQTVIGGGGGNGLFIASTRLSFMGNLIDDTTAAEHGLRSQYIGKGVISNNTISNIAPTKTGITLRGQSFAGTPTLPPGTFTEQIVISDNHLFGGSTGGVAGTGPATTTSDERIRDQIWERNWFEAGVLTTQTMNVQGSEITFRNNLLNLGGGSAAGHQGFIVTSGGVTPIPDQIRVYNNSFFSNDAGSFFAVNLQVGTNVTIQNNLAYAPNATAPKLINLFPAVAVPTTCLACNSSDAEVLSSNPSFAATPPLTVTDWKPTGGYSVDRGIPVPVFSDFFRVSRPQPGGGSFDIGATEQ